MIKKKIVNITVKEFNKKLKEIKDLYKIHFNEEPVGILKWNAYIVDKISKIELTFKVKTGNQDKVFGSVSTKQIKEELDKKNINIDKKQILLKESLSSLGYHNVDVELYKDIIGVVKVKLEK